MLGGSPTYSAIGGTCASAYAMKRRVQYRATQSPTSSQPTLLLTRHFQCADVPLIYPPLFRHCSRIVLSAGICNDILSVADTGERDGLSGAYRIHPPSRKVRALVRA